MLSRVRSAAVNGIEAFPIEVEVNAGWGDTKPPSHPKTFVHVLEECSLETDSVVHEMWVNLLASQLSDGESHPRLVGILGQLGPAEARLLGTLQPYPKGDPRADHFFGGTKGHSGMRKSWTSDLNKPDQPWNLSATFLCQHGLADIAPTKSTEPKKSCPLLLYLTPFGTEFLAIVAPPNE